MVLWVLLLSFAFIAAQELSVIDADLESMDPVDTLQCHRRSYTYKVSQMDVNGRQCRDTLRVWACWGRCDSNEISDYRFPFKKSSHPVCVHYARTKSVAFLRDCDEDALPLTARYEYLEAASCRCQLCSSSDTSCEGVRYRANRSHPDRLGFGIRQ
nr:thyrostimulin beta-5 subunit [Onthophagus taurus]